MTYYASPRISGEVSDCSMPVTFDQYSKCSYKCLYCFSQYQKGVGTSKKAYLGRGLSSININSIYKIFALEAPGQFQDFVKSRTVLQWGGLADPFCNFEKKYGVGLEVLKLLRELEYPVCFSTKGVWWLDDDRYVSLFKGAEHFNTKVSIITNDQKKAKAIEKGVPTPKSRMKAIEKIAKLGAGGATLRLRPYIIGVSDDFRSVIRDAANAGATAISMEFFCLETRSVVAREHYHQMSKIAGFDLFEFYRRYSQSAGYMRLNRNVKRDIVNEAEEVSRENGLRFYISDAHFKERCDNGSCCGLSEDWNYSRGQFTEALVRCKKNGSVTWPEIGREMIAVGRSKASVINMSNKREWKFRGRNFHDYLHFLWNTPEVGQSPYKLFGGIMKPAETDENGDIVYVFDETKA